MATQSLRKCAITSPAEVGGFDLTTQTKQRRDDKHVRPNMSVIVIRWISIVFCLGFWYSVYKLVNLFVS